MNIRHARAIEGWWWIKQGFVLFRASPVAWLALILLYALVMIGLGMIPYIGFLLFVLLGPVLAGGIMLGCQTLEQGRPLSPVKLFSAFNRHGSQLVTVGGLYLVASIVLSFGVMPQLVSPGEMNALAVDPAGAVKTYGTAEILRMSLVQLTLFTPVIMAVFYAPALIVLGEQPPLQAVKLSFLACFYNALPLLVSSLVLLVASMVALIPFGLGMLVVVPVMIASTYSSYRGLFDGTAAA